MTRFQRELSGQLGEYWRKHAQEELNKVREDLNLGVITIDTDGVARNCIGRVLMEDMLEKLSMVTDRVNVEATRAAKDAEIKADIGRYRKMRKHPSAEDLAEMRAAFGSGVSVVDVLTGEEIKL